MQVSLNPEISRLQSTIRKPSPKSYFNKLPPELRRSHWITPLDGCDSLAQGVNRLAVASPELGSKATETLLENRLFVFIDYFWARRLSYSILPPSYKIICQDAQEFFFLLGEKNVTQVRKFELCWPFCEFPYSSDSYDLIAGVGRRILLGNEPREMPQELETRYKLDIRDVRGPSYNSMDDRRVDTSFRFWTMTCTFQLPKKAAYRLVISVQRFGSRIPAKSTFPYLRDGVPNSSDVPRFSGPTDGLQVRDLNKMVDKLDTALRKRSYAGCAFSDRQGFSRPNLRYPSQTF